MPDEATKARNTFDALVNRLLLAHKDAAIVHAKMFGLPCIKANGKVCAILEESSLVCRLGEAARREALALPGALLWRPHGLKSPMREWICIPFTYKEEWARFVEQACAYTILQSAKKANAFSAPPKSRA